MLMKTLTPAQRKKAEAEIKAELDKQNFGGYCGNSDFLAYDHKMFQNFCCGELIISIGRGEFHSMVYHVIRYSIAWHEYWTERNRLEKAAGIES